MTTAFIMCSRKFNDCIGFRESLYANPQLRDTVIALNAPYITEIVGAKSMGAGFNEGIRQAKAVTRGNRPVEPDVYVFSHSDVRIWAGSGLWDKMIAKVEEPGTGFVGVAGTVGELPSNGAWWTVGEDLRGSVVHDNGGQQYMSAFGAYGPARIMDGVFLACSRHTLEAIGPWPEDLGWHFYDIWATERAHRLGLKNHVVPLPLLHYSIGEVRGDWKESRDLYMVKYHAIHTQVAPIANFR